ncbi:MAG: permease [Armatimonadetes bacterium]|nr:permease [Armatimonadota bacterium]PIX45113.1 MAG: permease [Armatimonadetes bacterium CG_4_8_14_3_um_filter_58_9]PIY40234.1 MAG: permease [Armatimonadetes bacterium CG_4_10_14_3_um_filter_59_10]PJB75843.1 MAG: permease [Armatimonadetes bacterium CG_4_9_14_3_um_filter_58_7]
MSRIDVLGLGIIAVDDLFSVDAYPPPDTKTPIRRHERQCGGLTGTALVAAARTGARAAYGGVIGDDELSEFVEREMARDGVDFSHAVRRTDARPAHSFIVVDRRDHTRTIFFEMNGLTGADSAKPGEEVVRASRVLLVDHYGMEGVVRATRIARNAGIPVVADLERRESPLFDEALALVDHLIVSHAFASTITGQAHATDAARTLWTPERQAVVVTCGSDGAWYLGDGETTEPRHCPAFPVAVMDTTGCGDVFHGAYASTLALGFALAERVRFASATAAIKATQLGGQAGIPRKEQVYTFLEER